jgi:hypothetical protein
VGNFYVSDGAALTSNDDTWTTPLNFFDKLNDEFDFGLDAAALSTSTLVPSNWYGPDHPDETRRDALTRDWSKDSMAKPFGLTLHTEEPWDFGLPRRIVKVRGGGNNCAFGSIPYRYRLVAQ